MKATRRSFTSGTIAAEFSLRRPWRFATSPCKGPLGAVAIASAADRGRRLHLRLFARITTEVTRVQMSNVPKVDGLMRHRGSSSTSQNILRRTTTAFPRPMRTRCIRLVGSTFRSRRFSAIPIWVTATTCSRLSISWMSDSKSSPSRRTADGKGRQLLVYRSRLERVTCLQG